MSAELVHLTLDLPKDRIEHWKQWRTNIVKSKESKISGDRQDGSMIPNEVDQDSSNGDIQINYVESGD